MLLLRVCPRSCTRVLSKNCVRAEPALPRPSRVRFPSLECFAKTAIMPGWWPSIPRTGNGPIRAACFIAARIAVTHFHSPGCRDMCFSIRRDGRTAEDEVQLQAMAHSGCGGDPHSGSRLHNERRATHLPARRCREEHSRGLFSLLRH